jgi:hypothetical protein
MSKFDKLIEQVNGDSVIEEAKPQATLDVILKRVSLNLQKPH